jgi:hypothetical protein
MINTINNDNLKIVDLVNKVRSALVDFDIECIGARYNTGEKKFCTRFNVGTPPVEYESSFDLQHVVFISDTLIQNIVLDVKAQLN